ncbi:MAG: hypothetical protein FJ006_12660 [Chloroflexi bacterium]|nr:hypothetical protein [Chloroflexota bacterium]
MTLHVTLEFDGRRFPVEGRTAEMVRWLSINADRINSMEQGSVTLHFSGASLKTELREVGNSITIQRKS